MYDRPGMRRSTRRLLVLLAAVPSVLVVYAILYMLGMDHLEGKPRSFGESIGFVSESLTTTGYGADSRWSSPVMQALVVIVQFTGLSLTLLMFPVFVVPFIEERFEARLANTLPDLRDAVLVFGWGPAVAPLVERLEQLGVPVVILEEDLASARRLHERGHTVVHASLGDDEIDLAPVKQARGVVAAGDDPTNAILTLTARQNGFTGPIVALVTAPARRAAMQRVGATAVFTPGHVLAAALASRASDKISPRVSGVSNLGKHLQIAEVRIDKSSPVAGKTLREANLRARTGATIVGWWRDGQLCPPPKVTETLEVGAILVAAGTDAGIARLGELATPVARSGPIVVIGDDEVAGKVAEFLDGAGEEVRRVSPTKIDGAIVGDPLDPEVLKRAGIRDARAVVVALPTDGETLFASSLVRDSAPEATVVAAARRAENVGRMRRAGADFALSVGQVAGQLLAYQLLGEEMVALEAELRVVRTASGELGGSRLGTIHVPERTGCSLVAVERGEEVIAELHADFEVRDGDALYITGTRDGIDRFFAVFPRTHDAQ
jgi:Trk K+ transport system NAD-binding subunit